MESSEYRKAFVEAIVRQFGTFENFVNTAAQQLPEELSAVFRQLAAFQSNPRWLRPLLKQLTDRDSWLQLAKRPADFDRKLDKILGTIRSQMKQTYAIHAHAPIRKSERDRQIVKLRQHDRKSFGQIKKELRLSSPQVAEQAYRRYQRRQRDQLRQMAELVFDKVTKKKGHKGQTRRPKADPT